jgi:hypothetical protein
MERPPSAAGEQRSGGGFLVSVFDAIGREDMLASTPANSSKTWAGVAVTSLCRLLTLALSKPARDPKSAPALASP